MKIVYARQPVDQSIFLAGPTPRTSAVPSWRPGAIKILQDQGFNGTVYVPEDGTSETIWEHEYDNQIDWEWEALGAGRCRTTTKHLQDTDVLSLDTHQGAVREVT